MNVLLQKVSSSVLGLLGPSAQNGLAEGAYRDELRQMEHHYEEQEIWLYLKLQEMLLESIYHKGTEPYQRRIIALANIRGKLWAVNQIYSYDRK